MRRSRSWLVLVTLALLVVSAMVGVGQAATGTKQPGTSHGAPQKLSKDGILSSGAVASAEQSLTVRSNSSHLPSPRYGSSMVYDAKAGYVILFGGGNNTTLYNDTWKFEAGRWTLLTPGEAPPPRLYAAMTYDATDGYVLLFGGLGGPTNTLRALNDTWKFEGGRWTNLTSSKHPTARYTAGMAYDAKDGYVLLFGGVGSSTGLDATWKFVRGNWTELSPSISPSARFSPMLAYDAADGYVVLFGGCRTSTSCLSDTWTFSGGTWTDLNLTLHPSGRWGGLLTYDAADGYMLLFGGATPDTNPNAVHDSWSFLHGTWTQLAPTKSPPRTYVSGFTYDSKDGYVVMFGGVTTPSYSILSSTWTYVGGTWTKV